MVSLIKRFARWMRNLIRDIRFLAGMVPALVQIKKIASRHTEPGSWSVATWWEEVVAKNMDRTLIIDDNRSLTFFEVDSLSNQYARMAMDAGIEAGGSMVVALSHENAPEFICWYLGLVKIGVPVALINTNVVGDGLAQCIQSCRAKWLIHSEEMRKQIETLSRVENNQQPTVKLLCISDLNGSISSESIPPGLRTNISYADAALHIFTSGTTGLPKAAKISHLRYFGSSLIFSHLIGLKSDDVLYCPLPLYHSSAMVLGFGLSLHNGIPLVIQKKFSVTNFWTKCIAHKVTVIQYIGELCRYLVMAKSTEEELQHTVRLALGNGLDPNVWEKFQERFGIPKIIEFYAATEANVGLVNSTGKTGAIGVLSPLLSKKHPGKLLRFDFESGQPYRNENGLCNECAPNEVGEFVGMINEKDPTQKFDGYSEKSDTDKKILHNVLKLGDKAYRSGDLMTRDDDGFIYFVDRIGDSIRWKGENVSTNEVERIIRSCIGVNECSVYGIQVPGYEGKAGMALIKVDSLTSLHLNEIQHALAKNLPEYARPVFLRFTEGDIETTATFKYRKQFFASQFSFDLNNDALHEKQHIFVRIKAESEAYVNMTKEVYKWLLEGAFRL